MAEALGHGIHMIKETKSMLPSKISQMKVTQYSIQTSDLPMTDAILPLNTNLVGNIFNFYTQSLSWKYQYKKM